MNISLITRKFINRKSPAGTGLILKKLSIVRAYHSTERMICQMLRMNKELYESYPDMLLGALKDGILSAKDVFAEMIDLSPEDIVQIVMDYGIPSYICDCNLDYEEVNDYES